MQRVSESPGEPGLSSVCGVASNGSGDFRLSFRPIAGFPCPRIQTWGIRILLAAMLMSTCVHAQRKVMDPPSTLDVTHRTRLILKDGSYQIVLTYQVDGGIVRYRSAERAGDVEEIPVALVDLDATHKWERDHAPAAEQAARTAPVLSSELAKEEARRAEVMPEVAPNLRLPDEDSVLVLDTFAGTPELVPLQQQGGDLNKQTAHNMLRQALNPLASSHQILQIKGERADEQMHVPDPVLYVRVGEDDAGPDSGSGMVVDTHGAAGRATPSGGSEKSRYVIVHVDVRQGARVIASFRINMLGGVKGQEDVIETETEVLPGGHWLRLKPRQPLEFGEYALMEIVSDRDVNLGVWDFGVHPTARENVDAIKPEVPRPSTLERRRQGSSQ
jgi:hypothetical protein